MVLESLDDTFGKNDFMNNFFELAYLPLDVECVIRRICFPHAQPSLQDPSVRAIALTFRIGKRFEHKFPRRVKLRNDKELLFSRLSNDLVPIHGRMILLKF